MMDWESSCPSMKTSLWLDASEPGGDLADEDGGGAEKGLEGGRRLEGGVRRPGGGRNGDLALVSENGLALVLDLVLGCSPVEPLRTWDRISSRTADWDSVRESKAESLAVCWFCWSWSALKALEAVRAASNWSWSNGWRGGVGGTGGGV